MKILKPILYCLLGFVLAFICTHFINNKSVEDKEIVNEKIDKDIPTIELQVSSKDVSVGDTVTYSIISKVESDDEAFENNRTFYYDFTGDGIWDLVTKKDTATYTFSESYEDGVSPKVAVEFRGKLGQAYGNPIFVKQKLRPILLYNSIGNTVIFRDLSRGKLQKGEICFEKDECDLGNSKFRKIHTYTEDLNNLTRGTETPIIKNDSFIWKYDNYGVHEITILLKDVYGEEIYTGYIIETKNSKENGKIASGINMVTIPETMFTNGNLEIFLSKTMNNTVIMYINNESGETCYVDTDIAMDSDGDGKTDNDTDIMCNKLAKIKYEPDCESAGGRVYFMNNGKLTFKNFYVTFEGIILELDEEKREIYNDITTLYYGIEDSSIENTNLKRLLDRLRKNLNDRSDVPSLVTSIKDQINNGGIIMDIKQKELLDSVLSRLSNEYTIISVGMDEYEKNKQEILALLPTKGNIRQTIEGMFKDFEENLFIYDAKERVNELEKIWKTIIKDGKKNKRMLDESDFTLYFCGIFDYYEITDYTDKC